jgi:hypothetical protein
MGYRDLNGNRVFETWQTTNLTLFITFNSKCSHEPIWILTSGDIVCYSSEEGSLLVYNPINGAQIAKVYVKFENSLIFYYNFIIHGVLSNDYLVCSYRVGTYVSGRDSGYYYIVDPYNNKIIKTCTMIPYYQLDGCHKFMYDSLVVTGQPPLNYHGISIYPNGLIASTVGSEIFVFNPLTEEIVVIISRIDLSYISYTSKGYLIGFYADYSSKIWNLNTNSLIKNSRWNTTEIFAPFLPILSMNYTVTLEFDKIKIWNLENGSLQRIIETNLSRIASIQGFSNGYLMASLKNNDNFGDSANFSSNLLDPFLNF